jgi:hypothetical protein
MSFVTLGRKCRKFPENSVYRTTFMTISLLDDDFCVPRLVNFLGNTSLFLAFQAKTPGISLNNQYRTPDFSQY